ncbi:MAG TPA: LuxR C-terminal-related transcriptional regulator [Acidimicrobiales bacterium]
MTRDQQALGTERCVPRLPEALVARPRLEAQLAAGVRRPVTLVSAPPGAGKTTLLASWLAGPDPPAAAWLNLDERDDEPGRLPALIAAALAEAGCVGDAAARRPPAAGGLVVGDLPDGARGEPGELVLLAAAFGEIERRGRPCVLVLDDVHELAGPAAREALAWVVERAPPPLDVVLATRADPPVGLERLRLDGRLGELRYIDLRFTSAEAAELFAAHGLALADGQTAALRELVDGWPAGLRLAAAALRSEPDPASFVAHAAAAQAVAADHLLDAVLTREGEAARRVLLRTSVTDRLTADLAVALTGDPEAGRHVADLERRGLFLVELDEQRCYRYHALFRALLLARLRQDRPGLLEELHRRAAAWFLDQGLPADAEAHARRGGDWSLVGRLVLRRWLLGTTEEAGALDTGPLDGIPPDAILDTPELALVAAAEACRWADHEDAHLYRARLDTTDPSAEVTSAASPPGDGLLGGGSRADGSSASGSRGGGSSADGSSAGGGTNAGDPAAGDDVWATARRLLDLTLGWTFGADDRARAAVAAVRSLDAPRPWTSRLRQIAVLVQAEMDIDAGHLDLARDALERLGDHADHGDPSWHRVLAGAMLAVLDAAAGDVTAAEARLARARAIIAGRPRRAVVDPFVRIAAALCAAQRGEHRALAEALAAPRPGEWMPHSLRVVDRAVQAATRGRAPFFVSLDAPTARYPLAGRALVALGVLEVIDATGRPIAVGGEGERVVADARQRLVETIVTGGPGPTALAPVELRLDRSAPRHPRTAVEMTALAALAADRRGDERRADRLLGEALDMAAATSIRAPLLELGPHLVEVLERISARLGSRGTTALDLLDRIQHAGGEALVEPLTDREIEVLQHLPTLMSNTEIARGLHLSVNTVKTHLKAVYRKLGVDGRREAVLRGRELELI